MARIYAGNHHKTEAYPHIIDAIRVMDDDTWVLLEFQIGTRDVDCLIIRPNQEPGMTATLLVTEFKDINAPIWGSWAGDWTIDRNGQKETLRLSNQHDRNPVQQAINVCNEVNNWLKDHYTSYKEFGNHLGNGHQTKGYPFLLITTRDESIRHTIDRPERAYGNVYYTVDAWAQKVRDWRTDKSFPLTHAEIEKLVAQLPVTPLDGAAGNTAAGTTVLPVTENGVTAPVRREEPTATAGASEPIEHLRWLRGFEQWVMELETRISTLEVELAQLTRTRPVAQPAERPLDQAETDALRNAVMEIARVGGRRDFPTVIKNLNHHLGYEMGGTRYNGFEKAKVFFDQAVKDGIIQYGPLSGPAPTIYLPHERLPPA